MTKLESLFSRKIKELNSSAKPAIKIVNKTVEQINNEIKQARKARILAILNGK